MIQGPNGISIKTFYAIINVKWNWKKPFTSWRKPFLKDLNYEEINENSEKFLRYNKDKTKAIISMRNIPSFIKEKRILNEEQIHKEIQKIEWR
jgi:hypothetical protein